MLLFFILALVVPLLLIGSAFIFIDDFELPEAALHVAVQLAIVGFFSWFSIASLEQDTETWNGRVVHKNSQHVSCSHSYPCNCRTECSGSGKNQSCSTVCDTCYEHSYDVDWNVYTTNDEIVKIDRVDRQGLVEPPRFSSVIIGEPTSLRHSYVNYVKASPGSLFKRRGSSEAFNGDLLDYDKNIYVYDYYRQDHLVLHGVKLNDAAAWNGDLANLNANIGSTKQVNVIVLFVNDKPIEWSNALEEQWIGGKKNDLVVIVSLDAALAPRWASVMCWSKDERIRVKLRDDVMAMPTVDDRETFMRMLHDDVMSYYDRKPMKDFEYLENEINPNYVDWLISTGISIVAFLAIFFGIRYYVR